MLRPNFVLNKFRSFLGFGLVSLWLSSEHKEKCSRDRCRYFEFRSILLRIPCPIFNDFLINEMIICSISFCLYAWNYFGVQPDGFALCLILIM